MDEIAKKQLKLEIKERVRAHYKAVNLSPLLISLVEEALSDYHAEVDGWDFIDDCDGCTGVHDYHPDKWVFDCLTHDFHWRCGRGGLISDKIFYDLMVARGFPKWKAGKRYIGVRIAWMTKYKWKHKRNGNIKPLTIAMIEYAKINNLKYE